MFGCLGFRVIDISEGQKGDQGRGRKMAKIQHGVKQHSFKKAAQTRLKFWVGKTGYLYKLPKNETFRKQKKCLEKKMKLSKKKDDAFKNEKMKQFCVNGGTRPCWLAVLQPADIKEAIEVTRGIQLRLVFCCCPHDVRHRSVRRGSSNSGVCPDQSWAPYVA